MAEQQPQYGYFETWEHSLLRVSPQRVPHIHIHEFEENMYSDDANFSAASILLQGGNPEDAWPFITLSLRKNPDSVHAWCNKGVYHLKMKQIEAEEAESKMRQLLEQPEPRKQAIVEYAYWIHEMDRSNESKATALQLFEETLGNEEGDVKMEHHYSYLKVLTVKAKTARTNNEPPWLAQILRMFVKQLTILMSADDPQFEIAVWRHLAKVQINWHCANKLNSDVVNMLELSLMAETDIWDVKFCIEKMLELKENHPDINIRSNFFADIGSLYLHLAVTSDDYIQRRKFLELALKFGKRYSDVERSRTYLGPLDYAKILFNIWAMKYYNFNRAEVNEEYHSINGGRLRNRTEAWNFLANDFYFTTADNSAETRAILEEAREHLERHIENNKGHFTPLYVRVKLLLGEPVEEIEESFPSNSQMETEGDCIRLLICHGRFLETVRRYEDAIISYTSAVSRHQETQAREPSFHFAISVAISGISRCEGYLARG